MRKQQGQTLIETLAAAFILVMGISAAVGLAIYAFGTSTNITKQIIATGLAREGLEAVRNMRDTNWLQQATADTDCYDYASSTAMSAKCYKNWLGKNGVSNLYCIAPSTGNGNNCNGNATTSSYFLGLDISQNNFVWTLKKDNNGDNYFGLNFDPSNSGNYGIYYPKAGNAGVTCKDSNSGFCRQIVISEDASSVPYNMDPNLFLVKVRSLVWWKDKKCPVVDTYDEANPACRVQMETYLTNWKNY